jgi:hypothetical protein
VRQTSATIAWARYAEGDRTPWEESSISHAACLAPAFHTGGTPVGGNSREDGSQTTPPRRGGGRATNPRSPRRTSPTSVEPIQKGIIVAAAPASAGRAATRTHQLPGFGLGCGEALGELTACTPSPVTERQSGGTPRPTTVWARRHQGGSTLWRRSERRLRPPNERARPGGESNPASLSPVGLPRRDRQRKLGPTPSGVWPCPGCAVGLHELLEDFAPHRIRVDRLSRDRRLAAAVIL